MSLAELPWHDYQAPAPAQPRPRAPRPATALQPATATEQLWLLEGPPPMPATYGDCQGPAHQALMAECGGTCPVLRCRHHLALWAKDNGAIKVEGAVAHGRTARGTRALTHVGEDALATMVVDLADRLAAAGMPSMCTLEYADRYRMTPKGLRWLLGLRTRRMTTLLADAADELDIARARERRRAAAQKAEAHAARRAVEASELVRIKRKPVPCR